MSGSALAHAPIWQPRIFPSFVLQESACIRGARAREEGALRRPVYDAVVAGMGPARRAEFLSGRECAERAVVACAPELGEQIAASGLPIGPDRAPRWPRGLVGSIAHTAEVASAVVARASDARGVGLDIEKWMDPRTAREVRSVIGSDAELARVRRRLGLDEASALTLIFSVKESVFKCLYPMVLRFFDYREAEVVAVGADRDARVPLGARGSSGSCGSCAVRIRVDLHPDFEAGTRIEVKFAMNDLHIHSGALWPPCADREV